MTPPGHILSVLEVVALRTREEKVSALALEAPGLCGNMAFSSPSARESHCHYFAFNASCALWLRNINRESTKCVF